MFCMPSQVTNFKFLSVCKNPIYMPEVNDLPKLDYENLEEIVAVRQVSFGVAGLRLN